MLYLLGIVSSFWLPWLAGATYVAVALMWLVPVPDCHTERTLRNTPAD